MIKIRRYADTDHDAVWALHNEALKSTGAYLGNGPWDDDLHHIENVHIENGGDFFVGLLNGEIVAMGALKKSSGSRAEIKRMRVAPSLQRRGYGQAIFDKLQELAIVLGYKTLHLDTSVEQEAAQHLYENNGFLEVGRGKVGNFECIYYEKRHLTNHCT